MTDMADMTGKVCLVTGANAGIGLETARGLAAMGATVVMTARDLEKGAAAVADVEASTGSETVELLELDLASLAKVRASAAEFLGRFDRLDVLVNNAGLFLSERQETEDGFEATFGVCHLGHFALTLALLDLLEASAPARIVNLSSDGHRAARAGLDFDDLQRTTRAYGTGFGAYADAKLANVLFTVELARRLEGKGVTSYAVHPGGVASNFGRDGDMKGFAAFSWKLIAPFLLSSAKGARTSLYCATAPELAEVSGGYFARRKQKAAAGPGTDPEAAKRLWEVSEALIAG